MHNIDYRAAELQNACKRVTAAELERLIDFLEGEITGGDVSEMSDDAQTIMEFFTDYLYAVMFERMRKYKEILKMLEATKENIKSNEELLKGMVEER